MLGDALRLVRERLPESKAVGEVDDGRERITRFGSHEQGVGGPVRCANLKLLFDHAWLQASTVPARDG